MAKMTDTEYQNRRNRLIPKAEAHADNKAGEKPTGDDCSAWYALWNKLFFGEMDRLAHADGIMG